MSGPALARCPNEGQRASSRSGVRLHRVRLVAGAGLRLISAPMSEPLLNEDTARFIQSGLSITVAGCGERLVPSIAKAAGCRVDQDRRMVTVLLFAEGAEALCGDLARNGRIAVCFSRPSTHETVQLKGSDARAGAASPQDIAAARRSLDLFAEDISRFGWQPVFVDTLFWRSPVELLAVRFTPEGAFAQTPGARAGRPLAP